jgi:hypothetical protein
MSIDKSLLKISIGFAFRVYISKCLSYHETLCGCYFDCGVAKVISSLIALYLIYNDMQYRRRGTLLKLRLLAHKLALGA